MNKAIFLGALASALATNAMAEEVPFSSERWEFGGEYRVEEHEGREAIFLNNGIARLEDVQFKDGTIEYDILLPSNDRGFSGIYWRLRDRLHGEDFYVRHHQSGNADANQYSPLFNGSAAWQLYYGPQYAVPTPYKYNEWMHIKIVSRDDEADIYIDSDTPTLRVNLKNENLPGGISVWSAFAPAWFANFSYEAGEPEIIGATPEPFPDLVPGAITDWQISNAFAEANLENVFELTPEEHTWTLLMVEDKGYANMARIQGSSEEANTAFAKITITADEATSRNISFGYSDRVKVYLNGRLVYSGNNGYQTRDYRYLGTVGLFDTAALHLDEGENELLFAVSESFGGWGIMAAIENRQGLTISP